jgi:hypothetical protein
MASCLFSTQDVLTGIAHLPLYIKNRHVMPPFRVCWSAPGLFSRKDCPAALAPD